MAGELMATEEAFLMAFRERLPTGIPPLYQGIPGMATDAVLERGHWTPGAGMKRWWKPLWHRRGKYDYLASAAEALWNA